MGFIKIMPFLVAALIPMGEPKKDLEDIERDTKALVFYLQDKEDHKEYCPEIDWKQPPLATYKKDPKSHLPEDCKQ